MESPWRSSGRSSQETQQRVSSKRLRKRWAKLQCDRANFIGRTIFSSMFNDIFWKKEKYVKKNSRNVGEHAQRFPRGHWSFLGPGSEKKWYGTCSGRTNGSWDRTAEKMLENFQKNWPPNLSMHQHL